MTGCRVGILGWNSILLFLRWYSLPSSVQVFRASLAIISNTCSRPNPLFNDEPPFHNSELASLTHSSAMEVAKLNSSSTESPNAVGVGVQDPVESKVRHVYVLARPLKVAGVFSFLSHGKFPLCHWGVLLSELEYLEKRANVFLEFFGEVRTSPGFLTEHTHKVWGSLFDLYRDPITHKNKPHVVYNFGHSELHREWRVLALRKVGTTMFQDGQIYEKGLPHFFASRKFSKGIANRLFSPLYHFNLPTLRWIFQQLSKFR